jgi:hypothetical protein
VNNNNNNINMSGSIVTNGKSSQNWQPPAVDCLVELCTANDALLSGKFGGAVTKQAKDKVWADIAAK